MNLCKSLCFSIALVLAFAAAAFSQGENQQQQRPRIVPDQPAQTVPQTQKRPTLTNQIIVQTPAPLVKKTVLSQPTNSAPSISAVKNYNAVFSSRLLSAIQDKIGIPYRYGSTGPNSYDCSGLVWSVFQEAGFYFERSSAKTLWQNSVPVEGDDRFKFGTLVFFNSLGHIGIVVDDKGFYHASSSKGVTYSPLDGYWAKRIVGYRRLVIEK